MNILFKEFSAKASLKCTTKFGLNRPITELRSSSNSFGAILLISHSTLALFINKYWALFARDKFKISPEIASLITILSKKNSLYVQPFFEFLLVALHCRSSRNPGVSNFLDNHWATSSPQSNPKILSPQTLL